MLKLMQCTLILERLLALEIGFSDGKWVVPNGPLTQNSIAAVDALHAALPTQLGGTCVLRIRFPYHRMQLLRALQQHRVFVFDSGTACHNSHARRLSQLRVNIRGEFV
jgi:hypothetical protein